MLLDRNTYLRLKKAGYAEMRAFCERLYRQGFEDGVNADVDQQAKNVEKLLGVVCMKDKINKELAAHFKDMHGKPIAIGSILINPDDYEFEVKFGIHKMFCPVDKEYMDTLGVYCTCSLFPEEVFPLGQTEEWAKIKEEEQ